MTFNPEVASQHRIVLLSGSEEALRRRALKEMERVATTDGDFDFESIQAVEGSAAGWLGSVSTVPFLSPKRTLVVRNLLRAGPPEDAFFGADSALKALPETSLLILVADDEQGDEDKQRKMEALRKKWDAYIKKQGGFVVSFTVDPKNVKAALKSELLNAGRTMSERALETMVEMCGGSLSRCIEEMEKLILFSEGSESISDTDVKRVVTPSREWNVYNLMTAALEGNVAEALRQLRVLVGATSKPEEAAFQRIFPTVHRQLRIVWQARVLIEHKANPNSVPEKVRMLLPVSGSIADEQDWKANAAMRSAKRLSLNQIARCMQAVNDADARIKGVEDGFTVPDTLERMVLEMAAAVRGAA